MAYVYLHRAKDTNEVFYVGMGCSPNYKRSRTIVKRNPEWHAIANNRGFNVEIIADNVGWGLAQVIERATILFYGRIDLGTGTLVNKKDGDFGDARTIVKQETKDKRSAKQKGRVITWGDKLSIAAKGKSKSREHIEKMRATKLANPYHPTAEHREIIRQRHLGKEVSQETRVKLSKKVQQFTKEGTLIKEYPSIKDASAQTGFARSCISTALSGGTKTAKGYVWRAAS